MKNFFINEIETILDDDKVITHSAFTEKIEKTLDDSWRKKLNISSDVDMEFSDWCYPPCVQSGGKFDLRPATSSNTDMIELQAGVIICSLGVKYKSYCSNISRTFLIDADRQKDRNYRFMFDLQERAISFIKDGELCKDVYNKCLAIIEEKRPDLKDNFLKSIGFGMGLEFKDSTYSLGPKNSRSLKAGMVLNLSVGFQNIIVEGVDDPKLKTYSLLLADTILVTAGACQVLTPVNKTISEVGYEFKKVDDDDEMQVDGEVAPVVVPEVRKTAVLDSKRSESKSNAVYSF